MPDVVWVLAEFRERGEEGGGAVVVAFGAGLRAEVVVEVEDETGGKTGGVPARAARVGGFQEGIRAAVRGTTPLRWTSLCLVGGRGSSFCFCFFVFCCREVGDRGGCRESNEWVRERDIYRAKGSSASQRQRRE